MGVLFWFEGLTRNCFLTAQRSAPNAAGAAMVIGDGIKRNQCLPWLWHHKLLL
jgi:hypothetical protein